MNYEDAMKAVRSGKGARHPGMGPGWLVFYKWLKIAKEDYFGCLNPHTGSDYQFNPTAEDKARTDWTLVEPKK